MRYQNLEWTISDLMKLIDENKINLRPPYQRNFIWSTKDQKLLIESIKKGYPLPNFFIHDNGDNTYEMIDGQQRAITIYKYIKNEFADLRKQYFKDSISEDILQYKLNVVILKEFNDTKYESKEEFFYLVNKRGVHLNPAEVNHAYYHDNDFMTLVKRMSEYQKFIELDIFADKTIMRMNDRGLVEELAAYLFKGITDKRIAVEDLFEAQLSHQNIDEAYLRFCNIINKIHSMQNIKPLNQTRYKQRNDFYTLFTFIDEHLADVNDKILKFQYKTLLFINDESLITPSNDRYDSFKEYAIHCVSQSNSKNARIQRLSFFNDLLANKNRKPTPAQDDLMDYIYHKYNRTLSICELNNYYFIDIF